MSYAQTSGVERRARRRRKAIGRFALIPRTLFGRSLMILATPLIVVQLVAGYVFVAHHWETVSRRLAGALAGEIATVIQIRSNLEPEQRAGLMFLVQQRLWLDSRFEQGVELHEVSKRPGLGLFELALFTALQHDLKRKFHIDSDSKPRYVTVSVQLDDGVLHFTTPRKRLFTSTTYLVIIWMVGTSILLLGAAVFFLRKQMRPIDRLAEAADSFGKGREVPDFKLEGAVEVRQAASAFLLMRDRIRRQIEQRTDMLAGVSHDLRTPITRMKLQLAMLGEDEEIANLKSDVAEMETMIEGYLAFARGEGAEAPAAIDLAELLGNIVAGARRQDGDISLEVRGDMVVSARADALRRAITNLIDNALRYADRVVVTAARRENGVTITIDDDGPGIPEDRRADVFRAFERLEESRNVETGGVGLGLTIARDVVRGHGGEISLDESPLGGLRAAIRLPV